MRDSNGNMIKTIERGICMHCGEEVVWNSESMDYATVISNKELCSFYHLDHNPIIPKSENFSNLYEKLQGA